jgi:hypothetical protein
MQGAAQIGDLERLDDALRVAPAPSCDLFRRTIQACARPSSPRQSGKISRIDRLIEAGAWTEATLGAIELELLDWTVRRIGREQGEWLCSLSRQPNVPLVLDETADASHEILALAILRAFVEARRRDAVAPQAVSSVPQLQPAPEQFICCDDFA